MTIDKDRIAIIKMLHLRQLTKPKKILVPKVPHKTGPRTKMSSEDQIIRRRICQQRRVDFWKENHLCVKCGAEPITIFYACGESIFLEQLTALCPKHSKHTKIKEKVNVPSNDATNKLHTVDAHGS